MRKVLIYGGKKDRYHDFTEQSPLLAGMVKEAGFDCDIEKDESVFKPDRIRPYDAILMAASTGTLSARGERNLLDAVIGNPWGNTGSPKGLFAFHGATVVSSGSGMYQRMIGARFLTHPKMGEAFRLTVTRPDHPVTRGVTDFSLVDELYMMEYLSGFETLLSASYEGFTLPIAWVKPYGMGRVCYCALGHSCEQLEDANVRRIMVNAIAWSASS